MCGGVNYIIKGERLRVFFPNPEARLPILMRDGNTYWIISLGAKKRTVRKFIQGLVAHYNGDESRVYVVTVEPDILKKQIHDRWPRIITSKRIKSFYVIPDI